MKTFGELVTQIKRGLLELCNDLLGAGAAQSLGPAHAYGKSFLIFQSVRQLQDAIQNQENRLKALVGKESTTGPMQSNDTKTWKVVDAIYQSQSLIDRYLQDPSRYTHHGIAEWLKQEATNCGLTSDVFPDVSGEVLSIIGKGFVLDLTLEDQEKISAAKLTITGKGQDSVFDCPEIVDFLKNDMREHISHLFSMAARLDAIEKEHPSAPPLHAIHVPCALDFKMSLGGLRFPFAPNYEAVLTFDYFDQDHRMPMIVVDPPIVMPMLRLQEIQDLCDARFSIDALVSAPIASMLEIHSRVDRTINGRPVRLILNDREARNAVLSIKLARLPVKRLENFAAIVGVLRKAATWCSIIQDTFAETEDIGQRSPPAVDIAPTSEFSLAANYWHSGSLPSYLLITVTDDGALTTSSDALNAQLGSDATFSDIIMRLVQ